MVDPIVNSFAVRTWLDSPAGQSKLNILQVFCSTLIMGVTTLIVVSLVIAPFKEIEKEPEWTMVTVALTLACTSTGAGFALATSRKPSNDLGVLAANATQSWFIAYALLEGPAFLCMIFFMFVGSNLEKGILLGVAIGLIALMAVRFPTKNRFLEAMGTSE
ncbi:MAG: hypothetical protein NT142_04655 [Planctomycetota bacterium]|nr:hypothetical protein [Planctomycetota bacterium]